jgi:formate C-acetyltransferase
MYNFKPATERAQRYRELVRDRVIRGDSSKLVIQAEANERYADIVPIIKRALVTKEICERIPVRIEDDELLVGSKSKYFCGSSPAGWVAAEDIEGTWSFSEEDQLWHNPENEELKLTISQEDIDLTRKYAPILGKHAAGRVSDAWAPDGAKEYFELEASDYSKDGTGIMWIPCGHLTPGWGRIINVGYGAIRKKAQDFMDAHEGNLMGNDISKYMFYKSATLACDGVSTLVRRYSEACLEKAKDEKDPARKLELEGMADGLAHIATEPARNFWEALQAVLMYQLFLGLAGGYPAPAFGRFDQYTWPFLEKELAAGTLDLNSAQELVDFFFLKSNCYYEVGVGFIALVTGIGNTYHHTTIGGCDPKTGKDATNPVTYMVLESIGRLKLHDPTTSLRITRDTPDELWGCALETSKLVGGLPLFQNDDVIIPGCIKELGFSLEDARDYSLIGCQEIVGSGNDYPAPNGTHAHASVHHAVIFSMAINNGINPMNGKQAKLHTGYLYEMENIEQVREAYRLMADYVLKWYVTINNYAEYLTTYNFAHADLSISMDGCMEQGIDCAAGGCKYNSYGGTATGLATIADCLATIKYMCYDNKKITTRELYDAVMANWEGYEPLRQQILNEVPHYGNADPYVDDEMQWTINNYYKMCSECSSPRCKVYKAGLYGASDHVVQGWHSWATPDGRKKGEPIADAMSPAQSRDNQGPTAVFVSSCCFDHTKFMDGIALNLRMHPTVLSRDDGIAKLRDMTRAYMDNGGMECQYNVVDTETLRKAQVSPTDYRDLVVRIAGYSAYFVELSSDNQNDIISRNENRI